MFCLNNQATTGYIDFAFIKIDLKIGIEKTNVSITMKNLKVINIVFLLGIVIQKTNN
jgi:hypothetical protein